jgi:hypothetical protein
MGSEWVDGGPSLGSAIGSIFTGLEAAPGKALNNMATADEIAWNRRVKGANIKASDAYAAALPPAEAAPRIMPVVGPFTGDPTDPATTRGLPRAPVEYIDPRDQALADAQRNLAIAGGSATLLKDPSQWAPQLGYGRVASRGRAATEPDRAEDVFLTTGRYPTADESKLKPAQNFTIQNADGTSTGQTISTRDGVRTVDGQLISTIYDPTKQRLVETGSATALPKLDEGVARERLNVIARQTQGRDLTPEEAFTVKTYAPEAYKASRVVESEGGVPKEKYVHTEEMPAHVVELLNRAGLLRGPATAATNPTVSTAANPAARPAVPTAPGPGATDETGAPVYGGTAGRPAVATAPPTPAPIVPADAAAAAFNPNASRVTAVLGSDPNKIRDDVLKTQEFKDYLSAVPSYNTIVRAATMPPSNATDLNIIYGIAKLFDPGSVVREGELQLASSTGTVGQRLSAMYSKLFNDQGTLDPEARANLVEQARVRMGEYKQNKDVVANYYGNTVAPSQKVAPELAVPPVPEMLDFKREDIVKAAGRGGPRAGSRTAAPTATAPRPRSTDDILEGR